MRKGLGKILMPLVVILLLSSLSSKEGFTVNNIPGFANTTHDTETNIYVIDNKYTYNANKGTLTTPTETFTPNPCIQSDIVYYPIVPTDYPEPICMFISPGTTSLAAAPHISYDKSTGILVLPSVPEPPVCTPPDGLSHFKKMYSPQTLKPPVDFVCVPTTPNPTTPNPTTTTSEVPIALKDAAAYTPTPWYQTWWAILLFVFGGFLVLMILYYIVSAIIMRPPVN